MGSMKSVTRAVLLLTLTTLSACLKDSSGSGLSQTGLGAPSPLVWIDQSQPLLGGATDTPINWIDATTVTSSGVGAIVPSTDEITYSFPRVFNPPGTNHPIQTNSNAAAVVSPEDQLAQAINTYRQVNLGGGGIGGIGGLPGAGGGGGAVVVTTVMIPMANRLRKSARAHCKHAALFHPGALAANNGEGDGLVAGVGTPGGRLPKCGVSVGQTLQFVLSGGGYPTATTARDYFVQNNSAGILATGYTYMGIGHWPGGSQTYYWSIIYGQGVNPVN